MRLPFSAHDISGIDAPITADRTGNQTWLTARLAVACASVFWFLLSAVVFALLPNIQAGLCHLFSGSAQPVMMESWAIPVLGGLHHFDGVDVSWQYLITWPVLLLVPVGLFLASLRKPASGSRVVSLVAALLLYQTWFIAVTGSTVVMILVTLLPG